MSDYIQKIESDYNGGKIGYDEFTDLEYIYYTSTFEEQEKLNSNVKRESELIENKSSEAESDIPTYYSTYIQKVESDYKKGKLGYDEYSNLKYVYYASTLEEQKELNSSIVNASDLPENGYSEIELNRPLGIEVDYPNNEAVREYNEYLSRRSGCKMIYTIIVIIIVVFIFIILPSHLRDWGVFLDFLAEIL